MLRIHFLQQWYALSDPSMEEALYDTAVMRRFAGINSLERIAEETTILNLDWKTPAEVMDKEIAKFR